MVLANVRITTSKYSTKKMCDKKVTLFFAYDRSTFRRAYMYKLWPSYTHYSKSIGIGFVGPCFRNAAYGRLSPRAWRMDRAWPPAWRVPIPVSSTSRQCERRRRRPARRGPRAVPWPCLASLQSVKRTGRRRAQAAQLGGLGCITLGQEAAGRRGEARRGGERRASRPRLASACVRFPFVVSRAAGGAKAGPAGPHRPALTQALWRGSMGWPMVDRTLL